MAGRGLRGIGSETLVTLAVGGVLVAAIVTQGFRRRDTGKDPCKDPTASPREGCVCNGLGWVWKLSGGRMVCSPRHWWWPF